MERVNIYKYIYYKTEGGIAVVEILMHLSEHICSLEVSSPYIGQTYSKVFELSSRNLFT